MFFCFCYQKVPKLTARHFFCVSFLSVFLKNPKKMTSFWEKSGCFLEKNATFLRYFSVSIVLQQFRSQKKIKKKC